MADKKLKKDIKKEINWVLFGTGPAMVESFKNEELDIGYMGLPPAIVGIDKGVPIKCIAGGHVEGTIMVARKEYRSLTECNNSLQDLFSQFKGKTIGFTSKGSIHEVILSYYLDKFKMRKQVKIKYYNQAEFIALDIKKGILEAGVGTPALAVFSSTIVDSHIIIPPNKLWDFNPSYGIFSTQKFIDKNPKTIEIFLTHHKRASYLLRESPLKAAKKIAKTFEILSKSYAKSVLEISPKYCILLSENYVHSTMEFVNSLYKLGYIEHNLQIEDIFDFKFLAEVHPEEEHY
jgi:NitT/TauT family transport system substrate-binding protein